MAWLLVLYIVIVTVPGLLGSTDVSLQVSDRQFPATDVAVCADSGPLVLVLDCTAFPGTVVAADDIKADNLNLTGSARCQHDDPASLCAPLDLTVSGAIGQCLWKKSMCELERGLPPVLECRPYIEYNYLVALNFHCAQLRDVIDICSSSDAPVSGSFIQSPNYPNPYPKTDSICHQKMEQDSYSEFQFIIEDFHIEQSNLCDQDSREYLKFNSTREFYVHLWKRSGNSSEMTAVLYNQAVYLCDETVLEAVTVLGYDAVVEFKIGPIPGVSIPGFSIEYRVHNATEPTQGPSTSDVETTSRNDVTVTSEQETEGNGGVSHELMVLIIVIAVTFLIMLVIIIVIIIVRTRRPRSQRQAVSGHC